MSTSKLRYLHLTPDGELPPLEGLARFKAVLIADAEVAEMTMWETARTLIDSGCLYALTWGRDCEAWHDAIGDAYLEATDYEEVPAERQVLTTWHDDEELEEVFWFARHRAAHPAHELRDTLLLHIADAPRREELEAQFNDA
jgi:hypothetical protein